LAGFGSLIGEKVMRKYPYWVKKRGNSVIIVRFGEKNEVFEKIFSHLVFPSI
jgi:hypothetical protein